MIFYQVSVCLISLIIFPVLLVLPRTKERVLERYGYSPVPEGEYYWFHGASVGEVNGLIPLIKLLREREPEAKILGTTTSVKGREKIAEFVDHARLLPIDSEPWINGSLKNAKIKKFIFGETEIWPALISYLSKRSVPIYLVNGRLSDLNIKNYLRFKTFFAKILSKVDLIFAIDQGNQNNFLKLGADSAKLKIRGNFKYDKSLNDQKERADKGNYFNQNLPVIVLGCIRPGEEGYWKEFLEREDLLFIVAPRHPEKFSFFKSFLNNQRIEFDSRSEMDSASAKNVILLDTFGELEACYSVADVSFIGGSLVDGVGGHNPMEAAEYGSIILMGPYYQNQTDCVEKLKENNAIKIVNNAEEIKQVLDGLDTYQAYPDNAQTVWKSYQGITKETFYDIF